MNLVHEFTKIFMEIEKKKEATSVIDEKEAYIDCLSLLQPYLELVAIDKKNHADALVGVAMAVRKLAECEGVEAI